MTRRVLVLALASILSQHLAAADWPGFRGPHSDQTYAGDTPLGEIEDLVLEVVWQHPGGSGYSGVSIASGRAVTLFADAENDVAVALDAATGDELWRAVIGPVYRGHDGSHDGPIATPLIAGGRVFVLDPAGELRALELEDGERVWSTHLVRDHGTLPPLYGFGTSPLAADGVLVVASGSQAGPPGTPPGQGPAVLGLDPGSGEVLWKAGQASVNYQSPIVAAVAGQDLVLAASDFFLFGLAAKSGKVLWQLPHEGELYPGPGTAAMNPVPLGDDRFFISDSPNGSSAIELTAAEGPMTLRRVWSSRSIRNSYAIPVFHDGHLYAFSAGFLTCVDAANGETVWRSRRPGDGFLTLVDGHLAVATKKGGLHVATASPEAYRELASVDLPASWTPPSYAGGLFYVRGLGGIAAIRPRPAEATAPTAEADVAAPRSGFAAFLAGVAAAADKAAAVDTFLAAQPSIPIVETGGAAPEGEVAVHFVYRGDAADMAIAGDMIGFPRFGFQALEPMTRVEGTDLFTYSTHLLADARVSYYFVRDFEEQVADPRNPRRAPSVLGEISWIGMPDWRPPAHLGEPPAEGRGRIETLRIPLPPGPPGAPPGPSERQVDVYLPAGYDTEVDRRYPVIYVHGGDPAMQLGAWTRSLDNLVGESVEPVLVAFLHLQGRQEVSFGAENGYIAAFTVAIVPEIDRRFRTLPDAGSRAAVGTDFGGYAALFGAFRQPGVVGKVAVQSAFLLSLQLGTLGQVIPPAGDGSPSILLEWGTYDSRSEHEAWDYRDGSRALARLLEDRGYRLTANEVHDGFGWPAWRNRTDKILEWLFPLQ